MARRTARWLAAVVHTIPSYDPKSGIFLVVAVHQAGQIF